MIDFMEYRGYVGSAHYSDADICFFGKLEFIRSLVTFEAEDAKGLRQAFEAAVDDYLEYCTINKQKPEQPFKGSFNIRTASDLHRRAALRAKADGVTLNHLVSNALETYLNSSTSKYKHS